MFDDIKEENEINNSHDFKTSRDEVIMRLIFKIENKKSSSLDSELVKLWKRVKDK